MKRCTRCILPDSYPGLEFDSEGVCSRCRSFTRPAEPAGEQDLKKAVSPYKGSGEKYDCIVAFSGGRDSTYILWHAVKKLGLHVLALNTDNGYMPEHTKRNIARTTELLGADLRIEKYSSLERTFPRMLRAWMRKPSAATVGMLCTGCSSGRRLKLPGVAQKYRIPLMLVGGGEPEQSFAESLLASERLTFTRSQMVWGFVREAARNPWLLESSFAIIGEFGMRYLEKPLLKLMGTRYPEKKVFPYHYIGWNEKTIVETITQELKWEKGDLCGTSWRSDCLIAPLKNYIYGSILGFHKVDELLAGMTRTNQISRETALERLPEESWVNPEYLDSFLRNHGTTLKKLDEAIQAARGRKEPG